MPSEAVSLAFLALLVAAGFGIAAGRRGRPPERVLPAACLLLALQALHVAEEFALAFHVSLPALLGLQAWSPAYFISVNLVAIACWLLALRDVAQGKARLAARGLLWFLALAAMGNALWHPILSLASASYFPGTLTALLLFYPGYQLARHLAAPPAPPSS